MCVYLVSVRPQLCLGFRAPGLMSFRSVVLSFPSVMSCPSVTLSLPPGTQKIFAKVGWMRTGGLDA